MVLALYILGCSRVLFHISLMSLLTLPIHLMLKRGINGVNDWFNR
jgi:hypothetical protein